MSFTDGLNMAMIGSPPLAVVNKVGMVIGFVPNEWCMVAGAVMQGTHASSLTYTEHLPNTSFSKYPPRPACTSSPKP